MSLMTSDLSATALSGTETNTLEFGFQTPPAGSGPQFGEVLATLQPLAGGGMETAGQTLAVPATPDGTLGWAPSLTVQALGEHLQLITPGAQTDAEGSLEDFARAQGLDDVTIGWLMGQTGSPAAATLSASAVGSPTGLPAGVWTAGTLGTPEGTFALASGPGPSGAALTVSLAASAQNPVNPIPGQASANASPPLDMAGLNGPQQEGLAGGPDPDPTKAKSVTALQGLFAMGASAAALWGPAEPQRGSGGRDPLAQQPNLEPTESLMATLRSPAVSALSVLQRQLQGSTGPNLATAKAAIHLRVSDLDLSQSLGAEGPDLQGLLNEWSSQLDSPSGGDSQACALAAVRSSGATATSPLGLTPHGSAPQLGIELADKFEQLAEKMGQAVAQRMLSEIEKGHWHLKLMLRPATLGHIEVEMRMRSGELDASFVASQNITRELLQESLPRLRETLSQLGMDVANMNVDSGRSQQGDGDPTPRAPAAQARTAPASGSAETSTITPQHHERRGQEGWDVMV
jgi:flagellar hook-length control protein FliK